MRTPLILVFVILACASGTAVGAPPVDYNRDIRPILATQCYACHGPDENARKADLRFDLRDVAVKSGVLTPGKPGESRLIERITSKDPDEVMPPPRSKKPSLTAAQIDLFKRWVAEGAKYSDHWSFAKLTKPAVPSVDNPKAKIQNPIDAFLLYRLQQEGLAPSPEADRATLIRRLSFDLTGLPPTPQELQAFVNDKSPDAYEKVVDRLLASPHYGERQARHWLDLARYADSNGYSVDGPRSIWPWRDWVIAALNDDMPFDRFTTEQLAGDLLPKPTKDQLVATGFHRNTAFNQEGGADPEQFRVERIIDRTNTTAAVWLGLTLGCAQCHDHKYDPIAQKDYYSLYAFFNSCDEVTLPVGGTAEVAKAINELEMSAAELEAAGLLEDAMKVEAEAAKAKGKLPTTLILRERKKPRESFVHLRGDFLSRGDAVTPAFPTALAPTTDKKLTRLDLAKWLTAPENPLTARVVVNRAWQQFFGAGLVETENDFGIQGRLPTHPNLLDWLAVEFREKGWSLKKLHRLIVTSGTYKQSSVARRDLAEKDPQNKLLARQTRLRLDAEIIRDAALSASGLLAKKIGGPGVYPPVVAEAFSFTQNAKAWPESKGVDRYRRGMYTFIWRQSHHPLSGTFDGADAQVACTRRNRSNTPLQALHLANDPAFVEFFAALGQRIVKDGPADDAGRVNYAFRLCLGREPTITEIDRLLKYRTSLSDEKAAWAAVGRVLMNLDEFVTRE